MGGHQGHMPLQQLSRPPHNPRATMPSLTHLRVHMRQQQYVKHLIMMFYKHQETTRQFLLFGDYFHKMRPFSQYTTT